MQTDTTNSNQQSDELQQDADLANTLVTTDDLKFINPDFQLPIDHLGPLLELLLQRLPPERRTIEILTAIGLYFHGFNVFPIPYASKAGWPWKPFQYTRVHPLFIPVLFDQVCNFAIMAGRTSQNLAFLDCETREVFEAQGHLLRKNSIPIYSVLTHGPKDGGHYYFRILNGEIENITTGSLTDLEVRGSRCYVLAPPSVHPTTEASYEWAERETSDPPIIDIRQIDWLPLKLTTKRPPKKEKFLSLYGVDEYLSNLSRKTLEFIYSGAPQGTRNNRLFAALCDMIGNEIEDEAIESLLVHAAEGCGLEAREIESTFKSAYSQPRNPARKPRPVPQPQRWQIALKWAQNRQWTGRSGQTDRAVFIAMCERAKLHSSEIGTFRASIREIAELAQVTRTTASRSIDRLVGAGHIIPSGHDLHSLARLFRLSNFEGENWLEWATRYNWTSRQWPTHVKNPVQNFFRNVKRNDAFERNALGKTATLVWQSLLKMRKPIKPKVIAEGCNLKIHQVYHALKKLDKYKLVVKQKHGWTAVSANEEWLDENVADVAGTRGRMQARKAKHQVERSLKAGWDVLDMRSKHERQYYRDLGNSFLKPEKP